MYATRTKPFSRCKLIGISGLTAICLALAGCGGTSVKTEEEAAAPEVGSLMRTFTLVDEQGRESGSLTIKPLGGVELRDTDGRLIGNFMPTEERPANEQE